MRGTGVKGNVGEEHRSVESNYEGNWRWEIEAGESVRAIGDGK
jgi:hypothetical protein